MNTEKFEVIDDETSQPEPDQSMNYTCSKCGKEVSAADADDNGGLCNDC